MRLSKDQTVRGVVVSLLVAILLLIPFSVLLNRISLGSTQGFNLAEVFASSRGSAAQEPAAAVLDSSGDRDGAAGEVDESAYSGEGEIDGGSDAGMAAEDFDARNASALAPVSLSGNATVVLETGDDESSEGADSETQSVDPSVAPGPLPLEEKFESETDGDDIVVATAPPASKSPAPEGAEPAGTIPVATVSTTSGILEQNAINRSEAKQQRVFQPASLPHYSFVKFSAYRQSLNTFFVTGITSFVARTFDKDKIAHTCEWHPADGGLPMGGKGTKGFAETEPSMIYMKSDENHGTYSPTIINCTFIEKVGADRKGGLLVLRISTGYDRWEPNLPVVAMEEQPGEVDVVMTPPEKLPFKYAFCGAPMHGKVRADWILQWMTYHHYLAEGKGHFFFYNMGGLAEEDKPTFQRFSDAGLLSITDILDPNLASDYPTWYYHQVLLINDCLHRSRFMAERVFFFDYDEFLQIPAPDTLTKFMTRHKDEPWISFGSIYANTHDCRNAQKGKSEAPLERMLWRRPSPECREKLPHTNPWLCIGPLGRRKYVVNPRETFAAGVHWALIPETGLNLLGDEAHMLHYRSAPLPKVQLCAENVTLNGKQEKAVLNAGWIRDESVSKIYSQAKAFPV
ncbi:hypothetical protein M758_11G094400 [Ceratodon purpureus]|nr:hypothetical protein M758_11G094400 [Ceratodon purpureus]